VSDREPIPGITPVLFKQRKVQQLGNLFVYPVIKFLIHLEPKGIYGVSFVLSTEKILPIYILKRKHYPLRTAEPYSLLFL